MTRPRAAVVGGGIAGLAAARALARRHGFAVTLFEASDRLGGKILTTPFAGKLVDEGPDAFLARVPFAVDLARDVGLGSELVSPAEGSAFIAKGDDLVRMPPGLVLGVPTNLVALAESGLVSPAGAARASLDLVLPGLPARDDEGIGALVRRRMGREVHELLVDPMLGGINAGRSEELSMDVAAPQIAAVARRSRSLIAGLLTQARHAQAADPAAPVFFTPRSGMADLVEAVVADLRRARVAVRTGTPVERLERAGAGWDVDGAGYDAVVVTTPAPEAARLLGDVSPQAAAGLAGVAYSSVALVTLAYRRTDVSHPLDGSGFLVPRVSGRLLTACSFASSKWAHLGGDDEVIMRASAGRFGDERALRLDDDELVARLHAELAALLRITGTPTQARVSRWHQAFPQYLPGHLDRIAEVEARLRADADTVVLAGAALRGVGIPTCIATGQAAAATVAERTGART